MVKSPPASAGDMGSVPGSGIPWSRKWQPVLVFLPEKSQGQRSLVGYSPRNCKESDTTEAHIHRRVAYNFIYEFEQHSLVTVKHPLGL